MLRLLVGLCILFVGIILLCTFSLEDVTFEIAELHLVEIERGAAICPSVIEIGTCPVEHRHEVVADCLHASLAKVCKTDLVFLDQLIAVGTAILDRLHHWKAFNNAPAETCSLNIVLEVHDCLVSPDITVLYLVKSSYNAFNTNLAKHLKCDRILLAKPTPSFFHRNSIY